MENIEKNKKIDPQIEIDFSTEDLEKERDEIAKKYNVGNKSKLEKLNSEWYYVENKINKPIKKWDQEMKFLFGTRPDDYLRGRL